MKKQPGKYSAGVLLFILLSFVLQSGFILYGQDGGAEASISGFALPQYRKKDNRLQFILYGKTATNLGALLVLKDLRLDVIRDTVKNVNEIIALDNALLYPIQSSVSAVKEYWKDKEHSRALLFTPEGTYDKSNKTLRGDGKVHFRSRELDMDGIGFDAFHDRRFIHIRSNVHVVIRPEAKDHSMRKQTNSDKKNHSNTGENKK